MGVPTNPQEAAPAYDDVFGDRPVNRLPASGSTSAYAAIAQDDDVELGEHHDHTHATLSSSPSPVLAAQPESLVQTLAGVFKPKPHTHCEHCDVQLAARQRRENEKHCCNMVAATFMVICVCTVIFGTIITSIVYRHKKA